MAQTALPGSVAVAYGQGRPSGHKLLAVSPTESFSSVVESAHGRLVQIQGVPSRMASLPQDQIGAASHTALVLTPGAQTGKPAVRGKSDTAQDPEPNSEPASTPLTPIPIPLSIPSATNLTVASVPVPKSKSATEDVCENAQSVEAPAASGISLDIAPPPAIVAVATDTTALPSATVTVLIEPMAKQAAGPITDLHKAQSANARSILPEDGADTPSADPPALPSYQVQAQPTPKGPLPIAADPAAEKVSIDKPDANSIASPDDSIAQLAALTSNLEPAPVALDETNTSVINAPAISTNTGMAEANRAVALRVSRAIASGEETLTIELHPAELGRVAVHLAFHDTGVDVRMVVSRQETFQAFSQDRVALEQQFSQAGVDLGAGGLDLQYSQTPAQEPKQASAPSLLSADSGPGDTQGATVLLGDNLVNIVA